MRSLLLALALMVGAPLAAARGGPDGYGYTWVDSDEPDGPPVADLPFDGGFPDRTSNPGGFDWFWPFREPMPFAFLFYGDRYDAIQHLTDNGWLSFVAQDTWHRVPLPMPDPAEPEAFLAGFWADLTVDRVEWGSIEERNGFRIRWIGSQGPRFLDFSIYVFRDGRIRYTYASAMDDGGVGVGMEDATQAFGTTLLLEGDAPEGFDLRDGYAVELSPPHALECAAAVPLGCGETIAADTRSEGVASVATYSCPSADYDGPEVTIAFTNPATQNVSFVLDEGAVPELDLLLLDGCDEGRCREAGDRSLDLARLPAGEYTIAVDGRNGAGGPFSLTALCGNAVVPASIEVSLEAGVRIPERKIVTMTPELRRADVMFAQDTSGSAAQELLNLKNTHKEVAAELDRRIEDLTVGLISFEDYPMDFWGSANCNYSYDGSQGDLPYRLQLPLTSDLLAFDIEVDAMRARSGGNEGEAYARVLWETVNDPAIGWRPGSTRLVAMMGDELPHDCDVHACMGGPLETTGRDAGRDNQVGTADDIFVLDALDDMAAADLVLLFLESSQGNEHADDWTCFTGRTGGRVVGLNMEGTVPRPPAIAEIFYEALFHQEHRCANLFLRPSSGFEDWLFASTPAAFDDVLLPTHSVFDIEIGPPPGTPPGDYRFTLDVVCDGRVVAQQQVAIHVGPCSIFAVAPEDVEACEGAPLELDGSGSLATGCDGRVRYQWRRGGAVVRPWDPDPGYSGSTPAGASTFTLEIACFDDPACTAASTAEVAVSALPDPLPPPLGATLRVAKAETRDVRVTWSDLSGGPDLVSAYEALALDRDVDGAPEPARMDAATGLGQVPAGTERLEHAGALEMPCPLGAGMSPCRLLFYKVRATSPCSASPGPTCNGFPGQEPCP